MNRCENYTLACEAKDCSECENFEWDGTGEEPEEEINKEKLKMITVNDEIDSTKEFLKGAMAGYIASRSTEEVAELFIIAFNNTDKDKAAEIVLDISRLFFETYKR